MSVSELPKGAALRPPRGLKAAGRRLWDDVSGTYELRPDELALLERAARVLDVVRAMDRELAQASLTVPGSTGQLVAHPLLAERRQHEALLARLLRQVGLPDEPAEVEALARSWKMRRVARARWGGEADGPVS